jgi:hypothetical protein
LFELKRDIGFKPLFSRTQMMVFCVAAQPPLNVPHPTTHEELVMFNKAVAATAVALGLCMPAMADDTAPDTAGGRYTLNKVVDGYVRLDTETGTIEFCTERGVGWACQAAPGDRAAYEREIERLQNENEALKKALLSHGLPLPDDMMPTASGNDGSNQITVRLPDNADIGRAVDYVRQVWHRFVDVVSKVQQQMQNKS